ncbi:MAG: hypothetical protein R2713_20365 [Ilumatobacteraceae bacterium]
MRASATKNCCPPSAVCSAASSAVAAEVVRSDRSTRPRSKRRQSSTAGARLDAAEDKVQTISDQLIELQGDLENEVTRIDVRWATLAKEITTVQIPLEKGDVKLTQLVLGWMPVA